MKILITGASSGLGAEMARQFAARGHDLVLTARRTDKLQTLHDEISSAHPERAVDVAALDVQDQDAVFAVFGAHAPIDRVVVNAGVGEGRVVGSGGHDHNHLIGATNFVGAVTQVEAAMQLFRAAGSGHLVIISSIAATRGMHGSAAVYSASKRGIAHLGESMRAESFGTDIDVTVVYPGYIQSEMTASNPDAPFTVDTETGVRSIVKGIEAKRVSVYAPGWPWALLGRAFRVLPLRVVARITAPAQRG